jgi:ABC-type amino acid transport substrate-binding protein
MRFPALIAALIAGLAGGFVGTYFLPSKAGGEAVKTETAFQRISRTHVMRCGFVDYEPANMRDLATGQLKGIFTETAELAAAKLGWKVEWVQSSGWGSFLTDLEQNKYDVFCGAGWGVPADALHAAPVGPLYYSGVRAWVRVDDHRFDHNLEAINDPVVRIAATDGSFVAMLAQSDFPHATLMTLPETVSYSTSLLNVATGKADVTFVEDYLGQSYLVKNPGTLRNITPGQPLRASPNLMYVKKSEGELRQALQMVIDHLQNTGEMEKIIVRYERFPKALLRVTRGYRID